MHHGSVGPLSIGTVEDQDPVTFDPERGPLVNVALQPSRVPVRCRVLMQVGGAGEGDGHPFVPGDEVLVAIPGCDPRGECVILGRLPNKVDAYPIAVAGQDSTKNALSFRRGRTPRFEEWSGDWGVFSQPKGSFVTVAADTGNVTLRDGASNSLQLSDGLFAYLSGDAKHLVQLDVSEGRYTVQTGDAMLVLGQDGCAVLSPGSLTLAAAGNPAAEHACSTEAVYAVLTAWQLTFYLAWVAAWGAVVTPAQGAPLGPVLTSALASVFSTSTLAFSASLAGHLPSDVAAAVFASFAKAGPKPPGVPGQGQSEPGIGAPGLLIG